MAEPQGEFAGLLRELRTRARLTQEELADAARLSMRTISDLERGVAATPQRETVRLLADALNLIGPARAEFETAARGYPLAVTPQAVAAPMRSLPRDVAAFTGRQRELDQLAKSAMTIGGVVEIHAIGGMAGVGKTAFAVHAAHQLAARFPGGQIFLSLHGHTPSQAPVDPADALASLLLTIGIPPGQIPPDSEARAALWRDQVADRQLLLVLDDVSSSDQVSPLLPGTGGSLVLVTSRRHLSALEDATAISLDTLPPGDAAALLVRLAGRPGLSATDPAVAEITRLCGFLPLAVGMVGRQLRHHPAWSATGRAAELSSARDRLALMKTENLSVAAAFDLSYAILAADQQRLFRRLGLHLGADIDGYAVAALDGISLAAARRGLENLYDQYLLSEPVQGRYRLHDLLREHARAQAILVDPEDERDAAIARLLDYFQHTSAIADARITRRIRSGPNAESIVPAAVPGLGDQAQALTWVRAERATLLACLDYAAAAGQHARVTALTAGLSGLLQQDGPWADAVARHSAAVEAAQQLGDRLSQANALVDLGNAQRITGNYPAAAQSLEEALRICRELDDQRGQVRALSNLGDVWRLTGDYPAAARAQEEALGMYRDLGVRVGQANALWRLGSVRRVTGDYPAAVQALDEALGIYRDVGDRGGEAVAPNERGALHRVSGELALAQRCHQQSLELSREIASSWDEAHALAGLGRCALAVGDSTQAEALLRQALENFQRIGGAEAPELRAELDALTGPPTTQ